MANKRSLSAEILEMEDRLRKMFTEGDDSLMQDFEYLSEIQQKILVKTYKENIKLKETAKELQISYPTVMFQRNLALETLFKIENNYLSKEEIEELLRDKKRVEMENHLKKMFTEDDTSLTQAFELLNEMQQKVIMKTFKENLFQDKIAEELQISIRHIGYLKNKALEILYNFTNNSLSQNEKETLIASIHKDKKKEELKERLNEMFKSGDDSLEEIFNRLSKKRKEYIKYVHKENLSYDEIANKYNIPQNQISTNYNNALESIIELEKESLEDSKKSKEIQIEKRLKNMFQGGDLELLENFNLLTKQQQNVFIKFYKDNLSCEQIAKEIGVTISLVYQHKRNGIAKLIRLDENGLSQEEIEKNNKDKEKREMENRLRKMFIEGDDSLMQDFKQLTKKQQEILTKMYKENLSHRQILKQCGTSSITTIYTQIREGFAKLKLIEREKALPQTQTNDNVSAKNDSKKKNNVKIKKNDNIQKIVNEISNIEKNKVPKKEIKQIKEKKPKISKYEDLKNRLKNMFTEGDEKLEKNFVYLSNKEQETLTKLYKENKSIKKCADELGIQSISIYKSRNKAFKKLTDFEINGVPDREAGKYEDLKNRLKNMFTEGDEKLEKNFVYLSKKEQETLIKLYKENKSIEKCADELGIQSISIYKNCSNAFKKLTDFEKNGLRKTRVSKYNELENRLRKMFTEGDEKLEKNFDYLSKNQHDVLIKIYKENKPIKKCADEMNVNNVWVSRYLFEALRRLSNIEINGVGKKPKISKYADLENRVRKMFTEGDEGLEKNFSYLSKSQQDVLTKIYKENKTIEECADEIDISRSTIRAHRNNAFNRLIDYETNGVPEKEEIYSQKLKNERKNWLIKMYQGDNHYEWLEKVVNKFDDFDKKILEELYKNGKSIVQLAKELKMSMHQLWEKNNTLIKNLIKYNDEGKALYNAKIEEMLLAMYQKGDYAFLKGFVSELKEVEQTVLEKFYKDGLSCHVVSSALNKAEGYINEIKNRSLLILGNKIDKSEFKNDDIYEENNIEKQLKFMYEGDERFAYLKDFVDLLPKKQQKILEKLYKDKIDIRSVMRLYSLDEPTVISIKNSALENLKRGETQKDEVLIPNFQAVENVLKEVYKNEDVYKNLVEDISTLTPQRRDLIEGLYKYKMSVFAYARKKGVQPTSVSHLKKFALVDLAQMWDKTISLEEIKRREKDDKLSSGQKIAIVDEFLKEIYANPDKFKKHLEDIEELTPMQKNVVEGIYKYENTVNSLAVKYNHCSRYIRSYKYDTSLKLYSMWFEQDKIDYQRTFIARIKHSYLGLDEDDRIIVEFIDSLDIETQVYLEMLYGDKQIDNDLISKEIENLSSPINKGLLKNNIYAQLSKTKKIQSLERQEAREKAREKKLEETREKRERRDRFKIISQASRDELEAIEKKERQLLKLNRRELAESGDEDTANREILKKKIKNQLEILDKIDYEVEKRNDNARKERKKREREEKYQRLLKLNSTTDEEIIQKIQSCPEDNFEYQKYANMLLEKHNLKICYFANKYMYSAKMLDSEDAIQIGREAFLKIAKEWNADKGFSFLAMALTEMKHKISNAKSKENKGESSSRTKINKAERLLKERGVENPTEGQIYDILGKSAMTVFSAREFANKSSLDKSIRNEEKSQNEKYLIELVPDKTPTPIERRIKHSESRDGFSSKTYKSLSYLNPSEQEFIKEAFVNNKKQKQLAQERGVPVKTISDLKKSSYEKLKFLISEDGQELINKHNVLKKSYENYKNKVSAFPRHFFENTDMKASDINEVIKLCLSRYVDLSSIKKFKLSQDKTNFAKLDKEILKQILLICFYDMNEEKLENKFNKNAKEICLTILENLSCDREKS